MSTLTGLVGGGGGVKPPTSLPMAGSFATNRSASATIATTTLIDVVNISSTEGYFLGAWSQDEVTSGTTGRLIITIDGTNITDVTLGMTGGATELCVFYPFGSHRAYQDFSNGQPVIQTLQVGAPFRFESSLRVRMSKTAGIAYTGWVAYYLT